MQVAQPVIPGALGIRGLRRDAMLTGGADVPNGVRERALLRYQERNDKKNAAEPGAHAPYSTWPGIPRARR